MPNGNSIITPAQCKDFREACAKHQTVVRGLIYEAINHVQELSDLKSEQQEKHLETLITFLTKQDNNLKDLHTKVNLHFYTILVGVIVGLLGLLVPYSDIISGIENNTTKIDHHTNECKQTKKRVFTIEEIDRDLEKRMDKVEKLALGNWSKIRFKHGQLFIEDPNESGLEDFK